MVNIKAIIYIKNKHITIFDCVDDFRTQMYEDSTPDHQAVMKVYKGVRKLFSDSMANKYGHTTEETENVDLLFKSIPEASKQLENPITRKLVFNLNNQIIINMNCDGLNNHILVTIHQEQDVNFIHAVSIDCPAILLNTPDTEP